MDDMVHLTRTKTLLIVYHSMTGGTRQMVEAAADGAASEPTIRTRLLSAPAANAADLLEADGYIFGTPENLAAIAGLMKDFVDRTYYPALDRISGRPYAILICAGSDGHNAARQVERIATGWRLKAIAEPLIVCTHAQTPEAILAPKVISPDDLKRCEELGAALAAGMSIGMF
jgi:multimeric flavodoxin WrbA